MLDIIKLKREHVLFIRAIKKNKKRNFMQTIEIELILADYFNFQRNLIVPNVSYGLKIRGKKLHECDLLICTLSNYLYEIEIKSSKADLIADKKKIHGHVHPAIKRLYFAYPEILGDIEEHVPDRAGILLVSKRTVKELRKPISNSKVKPITNLNRYQLARLGAMRIWNLKRKVLNGC